MKTKEARVRINPNGKDIFRNERAIDLFDSFRKHAHISACGIDSDGKVYFVYLSGKIARYTRREFLNLAKFGYYDINSHYYFYNGIRLYYYK